MLLHKWSSGSLSALAQGQEKMSKSDPNSAIFMEDTEAEVGRSPASLRPHPESACSLCQPSQGAAM